MLMTMLTRTVPLKPSADCRRLPNSLCPAHDPRYDAQEDKQKEIAVLKKRSFSRNHVEGIQFNPSSPKLA